MNLAIIGIGPRGSFSLENYIIELAKVDTQQDFHIFLFEETGNFGYGHVYDINQNDSNWININEIINYKIFTNLVES